MKTQNSKLNPPHSPAIRSGGQVWRIKTQNCESGSAIALVIIALVILAALGVGLLTVAYGVRHDAIRFKNETVARLAAEAGYEQALYEMSKQGDILSELQKGAAWTSGSLSFPDADCDYQIKLFSFAKYRPVYSVISTGHSGIFDRVVDVRVIQAISGWDMGKCRVPNSSSTTTPVYFAGGEIVDMPLHINNLKDSPDNRDIYIQGSPSPRFLQDVGMGESRYDGGTDKYASVIGLFEGGIYFNQPDCKITDEATVQTKVDRFKNSTKTAFKFTPTATATSLTNPQPAVQLEFFVENGVGKVRITNDCTVLGYCRDSDSKTYDFKITPKSGGTQYEKYYIYAYHVKSTGQTPIVVPLTDTYTTQSFGGVESEPGGQIFVEGNVVIGGNNASSPDQVIKGTVSVVATGNIWIADSVRADGPHDATTGMPTSDNPNAIGLVAQGVIKVVDPGMSGYTTTDSPNYYPGPVPGKYIPTDPAYESQYDYAPVASPDASGVTYNRYLSEPTVVEAAITVGGGGWGAENVKRDIYGGRKEAAGTQDDLYVRGTITEAVRGVVGLVGTDGYLKHYYLDWRLLTGILPGDIWLRGKYIPAPGGWHDYRAAD
jgi:hypothetical protein